ncbi:hypothetical protein DERF_013323 [Dermatophagoides farinae]|uniref:Uncharacterized protein n=1 Tax=Dermatophagoides farinae TaxID=6954 RepID=A0A922L0E1_DERFA|nr:hypothetical protein DERF_013323 [Dermatophagoides farinae]
MGISIFIYIYKPGIEEKINKVIKNNQINYNNEILLFLVSIELSQFEKLNSPENQSRENDYDIKSSSLQKKIENSLEV